MLELTSVRFQDDAHLLRIIDRIVSAVGRRVDESSPMVDARLADGSRVNAIIPPLARGRPAALDPAVRHADRLMPDDLVEQRAMTHRRCSASASRRCAARLNI